MYVAVAHKVKQCTKQHFSHEITISYSVYIIYRARFVLTVDTYLRLFVTVVIVVSDIGTKSPVPKIIFEVA